MNTADFSEASILKLEQQGTAEKIRALERIAAALEAIAEHTAPRTYELVYEDTAPTRTSLNTPDPTAPMPTRCPQCMAESEKAKQYLARAPYPTRCPLCNVSGGHVMTCKALT